MLADGSTAILPLVLLILAGAVVLLLRRIVAEDQDGNHNIAPELEVAFKAPRGKDSGLTVFYASQKGHGRRFAERLVASANAKGLSAAAIDLTGFDTDRLVEFQRTVFIVATYAGGIDVPGTEPFFNELTEMSRDFRVESVGKIYTSTVLEPGAEGNYFAQVPMPTEGYTAFFVEVTFDSGIPSAPFKFTTEVSIIPDVAPFKWADAAAKYASTAPK